jgi:hypothetical protein
MQAISKRLNQRAEFEAVLHDKRIQAPEVTQPADTELTEGDKKAVAARKGTALDQIRARAERKRRG